MVVVVAPDDASALADADGSPTEGAPGADAAEPGPVWSTEQGFWRIPPERPDGLGSDLMKKLRQSHPGCAFVIITALADISGAVDAMRVGADDYLPKPLDLERLRLILKRHQESERVKSELENLRRFQMDRYRKEYLLLPDEKMDHIYRYIERVADQVIVVMRGQLRAQGLIQDLKKIEGHPIDVELREANEAFLLALPQKSVQVLESKSNTCRVQAAGTPEEIGRILLEVARATGAQVRGFRVAERSLEDVFLEAVVTPMDQPITGGFQL